MRIHILHGYRGHRTNEAFLAPGEHVVSDELGAYLVANGHARPVIEPVTEPADPVAPADPLPEAFEPDLGWVQDYDELTFAELRELAESRALDVSGTGKGGAVTKADFLRAIRAANQQGN